MVAKAPSRVTAGRRGDGLPFSLRVRPQIGRSLLGRSLQLRSFSIHPRLHHLPPFCWEVGLCENPSYETARVTQNYLSTLSGFRRTVRGLIEPVTSTYYILRKSASTEINIWPIKEGCNPYLFSCRWPSRNRQLAIWWQ